MSDLIDRQAAIGIIQSLYPGIPRVPWLRKDWQERYKPYLNAEKAIRTLPSAQPEIIRCRDCKYGKYDIFDRGMWCELHPKYDVEENDFCSRAEVKKR